tara:strand:- start:1266 stop:2336 length:1071 start_codon:yes stop_codon:yes gene_type:complete
MKIKKIIKFYQIFFSTFSFSSIKLSEIIGENVVKRQLPKNYKIKDAKYFLHEAVTKIPKTSLLEGEKLIITSEGILIKNSKIVKESFSGKKFDSKNYVSNLYWSKNIKKINEKNIVSLFTVWSDNYYHWFTECIPKIILFSTSHDVSKYVFIFPINHDKPFIKSTLKILDISYQFFTENEFVVCDKIKFITLTAPIGNFRPKIQRDLSDILKNKISIENNTPKKKVYISRSNASKRFITNEKELLPILKKYNYQIVHLEKLSLEEQIKLIHDTYILIGLHGAGLTNMMFLQPQTKVIEIRLEGDIHMNLFYSLAQSLKVNYYYLLAKGDSKDIHECNIHVNVSEFEELLINNEISV